MNNFNFFKCQGERKNTNKMDILIIAQYYVEECVWKLKVTIQMQTEMSFLQNTRRLNWEGKNYHPLSQPGHLGTLAQFRTFKDDSWAEESWESN